MARGDDGRDGAGGPDRGGWAGWGLALLVVVLPLVLAGCDKLAGGAHPFAKETGGNSWSAQSAQAPRVSIDSFGGLPPGRDEEFLSALTRAAAKRDIAVVAEAGRDRAYVMNGRVDAEKRSDGVLLSWSWRVVQAGGRNEETITGSEVLPPTEAEDPWQGVDDTALGRVAAHVTESLTGYFGKLGYSTQIAGLPPPSENFRHLGPDAAKDINPNFIGPLELEAMVGKPGYPDTLEEAYAARREAAAAAQPPDRPEKPGGQPIRNVAVTAVTGSPGVGDQELSAALKQVIAEAGWPLVDEPGDDTLRITGRVTMGPSSGATQSVSLAWTVRDPGNVLLGTVKQQNQVPAGALAEGWGQNAVYAAQAAASGIFDLIEKVR